jgi:metallo-beta-lactamase class B
MHVTWHDDKDFGRFSSNGIIIINGGKALMIDTPADNDKTERLVRFLSDSMQVVLDGLIIGHFHNDCLGGLEFVKSIGVKSIANSRTIEKCLQLNLPVPEISFNDSLVLKFGERKIECRFFGAGHTVDNITVWLEDSRILFGGCLIKDVQSTSLGNLSDAVVTQWQATVESVIAEYPHAEIVIPGHGKVGGVDILHKTIDLVKKETSKLN